MMVRIASLLPEDRQGPYFKHKKIEKYQNENGFIPIWKIPTSTFFFVWSLYDKISIDKFIGKVDFVIIGAGIGKPNIMVQLEKLNVPCIDAGFIFEVWANTNKWNRSFCISDDDFLNSNKPFE